ncbi:hypothetical protein JCM10213_003101 [Rhodosporidiobolus nylandii]
MDGASKPLAVSRMQGMPFSRGEAPPLFDFADFPRGAGSAYELLDLGRPISDNALYGQLKGITLTELRQIARGGPLRRSRRLAAVLLIACSRMAMSELEGCIWTRLVGLLLSTALAKSLEGWALPLPGSKKRWSKSGLWAIKLPDIDVGWTPTSVAGVAPSFSALAGVAFLCPVSAQVERIRGGVVIRSDALGLLPPGAEDAVKKALQEATQQFAGKAPSPGAVDFAELLRKSGADMPPLPKAQLDELNKAVAHGAELKVPGIAGTWSIADSKRLKETEAEVKKLKAKVELLRLKTDTTVRKNEELRRTATDAPKGFPTIHQSVQTDLDLSAKSPVSPSPSASSGQLSSSLNADMIEHLWAQNQALVAQMMATEEALAQAQNHLDSPGIVVRALARGARLLRLDGPIHRRVEPLIQSSQRHLEPLYRQVEPLLPVVLTRSASVLTSRFFSLVLGKTCDEQLESSEVATESTPLLSPRPHPLPLLDSPADRTAFVISRLTSQLVEIRKKLARKTEENRNGASH